MSLRTLMDDPSIPDDVKIQILERQKGWSREMAQRALMVTNPEKTYESMSRDPMRKALGYLPGGKTIGKWVVPNDLQSLDQTIGGGIGSAVGAPFVGAELGGTVGGMAQGKGAGISAAESIPGALMNKFVPQLLGWLAKNRIAQSMSDKASGAIAKAAKKLYTRMDTSDVPTTPQGLLDFFGSGVASPAQRRSGEALGNFKNILRTQPAFRGLYVRVPMRTPGVVPSYLANPGGPPIRWHMMPLKDAMDHLDYLQGRVFAPSGAPRGGMMVEPDKKLAAWTRQSIINTLRSSNPKVAQQFSDLSRDYGISKTMGDVLTKDTIDNATGLIDHQKIYDNSADKKVMDHLTALAGPDAAQQFLQDVVPGRIAITPKGGESGAHASAGVPGIPIHLRPPAGFFKGPPTGPPAFMPKWPAVAGTIANQGATQGEEQILGE